MAVRPQTRSAGFQTCCIADFQIGRPSKYPARKISPRSAGSEACATFESGEQAERRDRGFAEEKFSVFGVSDLVRHQIHVTARDGFGARQDFGEQFLRGAWKEKMAQAIRVAEGGGNGFITRLIKIQRSRGLARSGGITDGFGGEMAALHRERDAFASDGFNESGGVATEQNIAATGHAAKIAEGDVMTFDFTNGNFAKT